MAVVATWTRPGTTPVDDMIGLPLSMMAMPSVAILFAGGGSSFIDADLQALSDSIATELRLTPKGYDLLHRSPAPSNT